MAEVAREVEEFVATGGWDQPPQLFALVPTAALLAGQPELAGHVDPDSPWTPVAQDALPDGELDEVLAGIEWPAQVQGCALVQEILVLPPSAEQDARELPGDTRAARDAVADHPERREARLVAAVLRTGPAACVLRLRGPVEPTGDDDTDDVVEHPELAPNLLTALRQTLL